MNAPNTLYTGVVAAVVRKCVAAMEKADCPENAVWWGLKAREAVMRSAPRFINEGVEGRMRRLFAAINAAMQRHCGLHWRDYHHEPAAALDEDGLLDAMQSAMTDNHEVVAVACLLELWAANPGVLTGLRASHAGLDAAVAGFVAHWREQWPLVCAYNIQ
jgi:hypothetical protein